MRVAIIGAGICGLYLAWKLAERGEEVVVFEKKSKIGKVVCSGLFSERILDFVPESQKLIQNQIDYCLIYFPRRTLKIQFSTPKESLRLPAGQGKFFVMNHFELDNLVANLSKKAGAKILLNQSLATSNIARLEKFERIVGCDGANSIVRKSLGLNSPKFYLGIQGFISKKDFSNFVETWPTKSGFIWKIPRGGEIEYGIMEEPKEAKPIFEKFLEKNNLRLEKINSTLIPRSDLIVPQNPNITLCGDAAGLTKPWSGGGVIWGLTAAEILVKNFPDFLKYQKEMRKIFLPKIIFSKIAKKFVYFFGFKFPWFLPNNFKIESDFLIGK